MDITCPKCGEELGGMVSIRHKGRRVICLAALVIGCDRDGCGGVWRNKDLPIFDGFGHRAIAAVTEGAAEVRQRKKRELECIVQEHAEPCPAA